METIKRIICAASVLLLAPIALAKCTSCPAGAQAHGITAGILVFRASDLAYVNGQTVGSCETLIIWAAVDYLALIPVPGGGFLTGAGFTGGNGRIILPNGSSVDVTPDDMGTTIVGPAPCGDTLVKAMNAVAYTITAADIAAGSAVFTFQYTDGTSLLGNCNVHFDASVQGMVGIAPFPKCDVTTHCLLATNVTGNLVVVTYSGTVSNSGSTTLTNVVVVNNQPAPNTTVFAINSLAAGQSVTFINSYTDSVNLCGPYTDVLTVKATDLFQCPVSNSSTDTCTVVCPLTPPLIIHPAFDGTNFTFAFLAETNWTYAVQYADSLPSTNWVPLTSFGGTGTNAIFSEPATNAQRFYRVLIQ